MTANSYNFFALLSQPLLEVPASNTPTIDSTITISAIVAICAIISPVLTAIINNRHQFRIKKMELKQKEYEQSVLYKKNILESYLRHAGTCIVHSSHDSLRDYGQYYLLALMYVPAPLAKKMTDVNNDIRNYRWGDAIPKMETITIEIKELLSKL